MGLFDLVVSVLSPWPSTNICLWNRTCPFPSTSLHCRKVDVVDIVPAAINGLRNVHHQREEVSARLEEKENTVLYEIIESAK